MSDPQPLTGAHGPHEQGHSPGGTASPQWQGVTLNFPHCRYKKVQVFKDEDNARKHMEKHLLSFGEGSSQDASESAAWMLVIPQLRQCCGDLSDPQQRNLVYRMWQRDRSAFDACYRLYARSIRLSVSDACHLGWKWVGPQVGGGWEGVALGTSGVLVVAENGFILTAFLPNQHTNGCYLGGNGKLQSRPGRHRIRGGVRSYREEKQHQKRKESWPPEKRLYYEVFRPALQFVRKAQYETFPPQGCLRPRNNIYAILKGKLPKCKWLHYDAWCRLREKVRKKLYDRQVN